MEPTDTPQQEEVVVYSQKALPDHIRSKHIVKLADRSDEEAVRSLVSGIVLHTLIFPFGLETMYLINESKDTTHVLVVINCIQPLQFHVSNVILHPGMDSKKDLNARAYLWMGYERANALILPIGDFELIITLYNLRDQDFDFADFLQQRIDQNDWDMYRHTIGGMTLRLKWDARSKLFYPAEHAVHVFSGPLC